MPTFRSAWNWVFGKHLPKPPNPGQDRAEAGWVPGVAGPRCSPTLLKAEGRPAVWTEDFNLNMGVYNREAMARIFVTEDRKAEAEAIIKDFTGTSPRHRKL